MFAVAPRAGEAKRSAPRGSLTQMGRGLRELASAGRGVLTAG